jgi:hypothetical protein
MIHFAYNKLGGSAMAQIQIKKNPNEEFFKESVRENIDLMLALATNGKDKTNKK